MKKLLLLLPILLLCSCSGNPAPIKKDFSAVITSEYNGEKIKAEAVAEAHNNLTLKMISPESLSGCTYTYKGGDFSLKSGELTLDSESGYLPDCAFSEALYNVLCAVNSDKAQLTAVYDQSVTYSGDSGSGKFTLNADINNGYISQIELKNINLKAVLSYS